MGQPVQVITKRVLRAGVYRYEIDRSLTGQAHESYDAALPGVIGSEVVRPPDVLANRLFATGRVAHVHVFSNLITVTASDEGDTTEFDAIVEDLFLHYLPGVLPTVI